MRILTHLLPNNIFNYFLSFISILISVSKIVPINKAKAKTAYIGFAPNMPKWTRPVKQ